MTTPTADTLKSSIHREFIRSVAVRELRHPQFTLEDKQMWIRIFSDSFDFEDPDNEETQQCIIGLRDFTKKCGIWGLDTRWNKMPCTPCANSAWKERVFAHFPKHILSGDWTPDKDVSMSKLDTLRYKTICAWISYCHTKSVRLWISKITSLDCRIKQAIDIHLTTLGAELDSLLQRAIQNANQGPSCLEIAASEEEALD